ncbi:MAG: DUF402 domain-containing protein [Sciscionella sp.]
MRTAITAQLTDIVNTFTAERTYSSGGTTPLTLCSVERWGLRTDCTTPEHPFVESEATWLLADSGLRLTLQRARSRHSKPLPTVLTAVKVQRDTRSWQTTDLLLGLEIAGNRTPRFARSEEFASAVAGGVITPPDADLALQTVHQALEELCSCDHDVDIWLARQGIVDSWPPR